MASKPDDSQNGKELQEFKYNQKIKGWRGPAKASMTLMRHTKLIRNKMKQMEIQKKQESQLRANKEKGGGAEIELDEDEVDEEPDEVVDPEEIISAAPLIEQPFRGKLREMQYTSWKAPESSEPNKANQFEFVRPVRDAKNASFTSPQMQVARMSEELEQRDAELEMLRKQLLKSHEENHRLVGQLQGYTGKHYEELAEDNQAMKRYLERMSRDNAKLHGKLRCEQNRIVHRLASEQELEKQERLKYTEHNTEKLSVCSK